MYSLLAVAALFCIDLRLRVYLDPMDGLEAYVQKALQAEGLPFEFEQGAVQPDLRTALRKLRSAEGEILFRTKLGRNEDHELELRDLRTNTVIARHAFALQESRAARQQAAAEFARKVKRAWKKKSRQP